MCCLDGDHIGRKGTYFVQSQSIVWFFCSHHCRNTSYLLPVAQSEFVGGYLGKGGPGNELLWGGGSLERADLLAVLGGGNGGSIVFRGYPVEDEDAEQYWGGCFSKEHQTAEEGNSLSMLQHIKHIHPGSPFRTMTTVRLLKEVSRYTMGFRQLDSHNT
jgi:hypothetical protein